MSALTDTQLWQISAGAILGDQNGNNYERLSVFEADDEHAIDDIRLMFRRDWEINNKVEVLDMVANLTGEGGHKVSYQATLDYWGRFDRAQCEAELQKLDIAEYAKVSIALTHQFSLGKHGILAWDFGRCVPMLRNAHSLGWLTEEETWGQLLSIAKQVQRSYTSWAEYGTAYIVGRLYWAAGGLSESTCEQYFDRLNKILVNNEHAWRTLPWELSLD